MALPDRTFYNQRASKLPDQLILCVRKRQFTFFIALKPLFYIRPGVSPAAIAVVLMLFHCSR